MHRVLYPSRRNTSLRCLLGRHTGQRDGGTMMFTCPRCTGTFWQPHDHSDITHVGDKLIAAGRKDLALELLRDTVGRGRR